MKQVKIESRLYETEDYKDVVRPFITSIDNVNFVQHIEGEESNRTILLEVYNMNIEMEKVKNANDLRLYFEKRLLDKINIKVGGLDKGILKDIILILVLWGALDDFMVYTEIFDWFHEYIPRIPPPFGIFYCRLNSGETVYAFDTIENVANRKMRLTPVI